jgi:hypothetical protein
MAAPSAVDITRTFREPTEKVLDLAEARLQHSAYLELRRVRCDLHNGVITLTGHVSSYYLRQLAQAAMLGLDGIRAISNCLEVIPARRRYHESVPGAATSRAAYCDSSEKRN